MTVGDASDGVLIQAVLAGQIDRFSDIVRRYQRSLARVAFSRLGCNDLADEAVQETFISAFRSLSSYDSRYSFRTWLWTILLNECRRQYRRKKTSERLGTGQGGDGDVVSEEIAGQNQLPDENLLAEERQQLLASLLAGISESQADAIRLRFFGGLKFQEIAEVMQCSLPSAKARVRRGLAAISDLMTSQQQ